LITHDAISVDASQPGFVNVNYLQVDDGIDMGGRLCIERESIPTVIEMLHACLTVYAFPETKCRCGHDTFRVYESGPEQHPIINILNRRPDGVPHNGLSGLMMTKSATADLLEQLGILVGR
jgi:hypothetical protein